MKPEIKQLLVALINNSKIVPLGIATGTGTVATTEYDDTGIIIAIISIALQMWAGINNPPPAVPIAQAVKDVAVAATEDKKPDVH